MHPYTVQCIHCGETRVGKRTDGVVEPIRDRCPDCDHEGVEILAGDD
jgi:Zn finger protein HypA/HybF involved in hydrogenase expression